MSERIHLDRPAPVVVEISPEMLAKLDRCDDTKTGATARPFTPEEDAVLLKYYLVKRKDDLARVFGCCAETLRKRYNKLTEDN